MRNQLNRRKRIDLLVLLLVLFFSIPLQNSSMAALAVTQKAVQKLPLRIGIASMITPVGTVRYYQDIVDYLGKKLGMPVRMVYRTDYADMDRLLEKGNVDVAFICSGPYVKDHDKFGVELLAAPGINGKPAYNSYIIVNKNSPVKSFAYLKGKTFAFTDPLSNSGRLYVDYRLSRMHYTPGTFFKRHIYSYSHNKSIEMVAKNQVDGASVDSLIYDYMLKKHSPYVGLTRIIEKSPPFGAPPLVINKNVGRDLKKRIQDIFLKMHRDPKGQAILKAMMIDKFTAVNDGDYDSVRRMERLANTDSRVSRRKGIIYLGVIPADNPRIEYEKYQPLLDYLSDVTHYRFELVLRRSYEDTVADIGNGTIDIAFLGSLTYIEAHKKYNAVCILKPRPAPGGRAYYRSVIIARKDGPVHGISDLRGRSFAFGPIQSASGNLAPRYLLANSGIHIGDLSAFANFNYDESIIKAVLSGQYDAGAVKDSTALRFQGLGIKIIGQSGPLPVGPLVIGPKVPPYVFEAVKKALYGLKPDTWKQREILKKLDMVFQYGFVKAIDSDYAGVRGQMNAVPKTCGRGCHPKTRL
ncbi:MAG: phosphate/phosphite/phosphonate ABC transporter substrate-binding protein [Nitrospiraceae bacterium]|nr:phosphate/phosphite/phosphonate ABC transporter substrate-binding protein [Nitrospiraceae bacterium]